MIDMTIVVREAGRLKPDYSLDFSLPAVPEIGSYISVTREGEEQPYSEDLIVRKHWWRLVHPERAGVALKARHGRLLELFVECEVAVGPHASAQWMALVAGAKSRGVTVEEFEIERFSVPQGSLTPRS